MGVYTHQLYDNTLYINKIQKTKQPGFYVERSLRYHCDTKYRILCHGCVRKWAFGTKSLTTVT